MCVRASDGDDGACTGLRDTHMQSAQSSGTWQCVRRGIELDGGLANNVGGSASRLRGSVGTSVRLPALQRMGHDERLQCDRNSVVHAEHGNGAKRCEETAAQFLSGDVPICELLAAVPLQRGARGYRSAHFGLLNARGRAFAASWSSLPTTTEALAKFVASMAPPGFVFNVVTLAYNGGVGWHRDVSNSDLSFLVTFGGDKDVLLCQDENGDVRVLNTFGRGVVFRATDLHSTLTLHELRLSLAAYCRGHGNAEQRGKLAMKGFVPSVLNLDAQEHEEDCVLSATIPFVDDAERGSEQEDVNVVQRGELAWKGLVPSVLNLAAQEHEEEEDVNAEQCGKLARKGLVPSVLNLAAQEHKKDCVLSATIPFVDDAERGSEQEDVYVPGVGWVRAQHVEGEMERLLSRGKSLGDETVQSASGTDEDSIPLDELVQRKRQKCSDSASACVADAHGESYADRLGTASGAASAADGESRVDVGLPGREEQKNREEYQPIPFVSLVDLADGSETLGSCDSPAETSSRSSSACSVLRGGVQHSIDRVVCRSACGVWGDCFFVSLASSFIACDHPHGSVTLCVVDRMAKAVCPVKPCEYSDAAVARVATSLRAIAAHCSECHKSEMMQGLGGSAVEAAMLAYILQVQIVIVDEYDCPLVCAGMSERGQHDRLLSVCLRFHDEHYTWVPDLACVLDNVCAFDDMVELTRGAAGVLRAGAESEMLMVTGKKAVPDEMQDIHVNNVGFLSVDFQDNGAVDNTDLAPGAFSDVHDFDNLCTDGSLEVFEWHKDHEWISDSHVCIDVLSVPLDPCLVLWIAYELDADCLLEHGWLRGGAKKGKQGEASVDDILSSGANPLEKALALAWPHAKSFVKRNTLKQLLQSQDQWRIEILQCVNRDQVSRAVLAKFPKQDPPPHSSNTSGASKSDPRAASGSDSAKNPNGGAA
eukprot:2706759-Amphidinium_carterae.1